MSVLIEDPEISLEALMKSAAPTPSKQPDKDEEIDAQLWNMQAETPLFGTAQDQALLTTPMEPPPRSSRRSCRRFRPPIAEGTGRGSCRS